MVNHLINSYTLHESDYWVTENKVLGISFIINPIDIELSDDDTIDDRLRSLFAHLDDNIKCRVEMRADFINRNLSEQVHKRSVEISEIGEISKNIIISFEKRLKINLFSLFKKFDANDEVIHNEIKNFQDQLPLSSFEAFGILLNNVKKEKFEYLFADKNLPLMQSGTFLDNGFDKISVLKLIKPPDQRINLLSFAQIQDELPVGYRLVSAFKKIPDLMAKAKFQQQAKQESSSQTTSGQTKSLLSDQAAADMELGGAKYFSIEVHIIFSRDNEQDLKNVIKKAFTALSKFGTWSIESIGLFPSFQAAQFGSHFHFDGVFEAQPVKDEMLCCFLPLLTRGNSQIEEHTLRSLAFHRLDFSVDYFDQFNSNNTNANVNIIGQSGKGKSLLINRQIYCTSNDPKTSLIIVDVKGSHKRLISDLKGEIYNIELKSSSGINPIAFLKLDSSEKTLETVKTFLSELCLDDDEKKLNEIQSSNLESYLISYNDLNDKKYTLDEFIQFIPDSFERKILLKRFSSGGLLKHVFSDQAQQNDPLKKQRNKIRYYNFENIDTAANSGVSRAIMASILADFSFSLATKTKEEKLSFVSDETPFFLEKCFKSFSYLSKNIRALNGSLVLTVQYSKNLIVDGDASLIETAATTIFLSGDDGEDIFQRRFKLTDLETQKVFKLSGQQGVYSQFLIKDHLGSRTGNLFLTKKEYFQSTTRSDELFKLDKLKEYFPELEQDLLIDLLSKQMATQKNQSNQIRIKQT